MYINKSSLLSYVLVSSLSLQASSVRFRFEVVDIVFTSNMLASQTFPQPLVLVVLLGKPHLSPFKLPVSRTLASFTSAQWNGGSGNGGGGAADYGSWDSSSSSSTGSSSSSEPGGDYGAGPYSGDADQTSQETITHGVLSSLAWILLFPLGSILLRLIRGKLAWKVHAAIQVIGFIIFAAGVGTGIHLSRQISVYTPIWKDPHVIIGLFIFALAAIQPFLGIIHHWIFVQRNDGRRTGIGHVHLWLGRILIILGIINGGLGIRRTAQSPMQPASTTRKATIAYSVSAVIMFLLYAIVAFWSEIRRLTTKISTTTTRRGRTRRTSMRQRGGGGAYPSGGGGAYYTPNTTRRTSRSARSARSRSIDNTPRSMPVFATTPSEKIRVSASSSDETLEEQGWRVYRTDEGPVLRRAECEFPFII